MQTSGNSVAAFLEEARAALVGTMLVEPDAEVRAALIGDYHRHVDRVARAGAISAADAFRLRRAVAVSYAEAVALRDIDADPAGAAEALAAEAKRRRGAERGHAGGLDGFPRAGGAAAPGAGCPPAGAGGRCGMSGSAALLDAGIGLQGAGSLLGAFGKIYHGNAAYAAGIGKQQAADYTAAGLQQKGTQAYAAGGVASADRLPQWAVRAFVAARGCGRHGRHGDGAVGVIALGPDGGARGLRCSDGAPFRPRRNAGRPESGRAGNLPRPGRSRGGRVREDGRHRRGVFQCPRRGGQHGLRYGNPNGYGGSPNSGYE